MPSYFISLVFFIHPTISQSQSSLQSRSSRIPFGKSFVRVLALQENASTGSSINRQVLYDSHFLPSGSSAPSYRSAFDTKNTIIRSRSSNKISRKKRRAATCLESSRSSSPAPRATSFSNDSSNLVRHVPLDNKTLEMIFGRNSVPIENVITKVHHKHNEILFSLLFMYTPRESTEEIIPAVKEESELLSRRKEKRTRSYSSKGASPSPTDIVYPRSFAKMESKPLSLSSSDMGSPSDEEMDLYSNSSSYDEKAKSMPISARRLLSTPTISTRKEIPIEIPSSSNMDDVLIDASPNSPPSESYFPLKFEQNDINSSPQINIAPSSPSISLRSSIGEGIGDKQNTTTISTESVLSLTIIFELLPGNTAIQDLISSHFCLLQYRIRVLLEVLYHSLNRLAKKSQRSNNLSKEGEGDNNNNFFELNFLQKYILNSDEHFSSSAEVFQSFFCGLMTFPRLQPPSWLQIVTVSQKRKSTLCEFLKELCVLFQKFENPEGEFLLSTAITTILAFHTSWVSSILTLEEYLDESGGIDLPPPNDSLIGGQFSQLFGHTRKVNRFCRVIVVGENSKLVNSLLFVLSFFIRSCSNRRFTSDDNTINQRVKRSRLKKKLGETVCAYAPKLDLVQSGGYQEVIDENNLQFSAQLGVLDPPPLIYNPSPLSSNPYRTIARSMFAAHCKSYLSDFALMGIQSKSLASNSALQQNISRDLWAQCKFWPTHYDKNRSNNILLPPSKTAGGEYALECASCIVVNIDVKSCEVFTFHPEYKEKPLYETQFTSSIPHFFIRKLRRSDLIQEMVETIQEMWKFDLPPDSCMMYFEEQLAILYRNSLLLKQLLIDFNSSQNIFRSSEVSELLNLSSKSDVEMMAVLQEQFTPDIASYIRKG